MCRSYGDKTCRHCLQSSSEVERMTNRRAVTEKSAMFEFKLYSPGPMPGIPGTDMPIICEEAELGGGGGGATMPGPPGAD